MPISFNPVVYGKKQKALHNIPIRVTMYLQCSIVLPLSLI